ncbi:YjiH family protein [Paenibacillus tarimensis]
MEKPIRAKELQSFGSSVYIKFIVPSLIGILLFMIPVKYNGGMTIPVAWLGKQIETLLSGSLPAIVTVLMGVALAGTIVAKLLKPAWIRNSVYFSKLLDVGLISIMSRVLGFVFGLITLLQWGPEWIWSENTGGLLLTGLLPLLFAVFLFAGLFLPLLLDFGLLELFGTLFSRIMRPVFKLPGRSSIDCAASWVGDGTVGVLLTNKQYEDGYYTEREAAVISTTFSVVSLTFSIVVLAEVGLEHMLLPYYLTIVVTGLVLAFVMPRIPPLSRKKDSYYKELEDRGETAAPQGVSLTAWGMNRALAKASANRSGLQGFLKGGFQNVLDLWLGVIPVVMTLGTISLIVAEYTPFFKWIAMPFVPVLTFLQVPEAAEAAQTMLIGFADMFLPAILGSGIESEMTRFVIACLSVTQLIYMSEVGGLLLASKLPIRMKDLVLIFLLRTIIGLPIIVGIAHFLF